MGIWNAKIDWNPCLPITLDCFNLKKWKSILTVWSCSERVRLIISTPEYDLGLKWEYGLVSCLFQKKKGGESSMFISEREIWLKATAQAMVDLTILLRNTYHTCPNTSAWYWLFVLLFCFYKYGFSRIKPSKKFFLWKNTVSAILQPHSWIEPQVMWKVQFLGVFLNKPPLFEGFFVLTPTQKLILKNRTPGL